MNPSKIIIQGDYWDCQIYRKRLYLWCMNGSLKVIDWNKLVSSLSKNQSDRLALTCAFTNGNYLYKYEFTHIFDDDDFRDLLLKKFDQISDEQYTISENELVKFQVQEQDNPFRENPIDSEFISNKIFAITDQGLFSTNADKSAKRKYAVSTRVEKHWDCPLLSITANKYAKIALSGGSEGLFEYNAASRNNDFAFDENEIEPRLSSISTQPSTFANYQFLSIYSSSNFASSYLTLFKWDDHDNFKNLLIKPKRVKDREISSDQIFGYNGQALSWGSNEKIYKAFEGGLDIVHFNNYAKEERDERIFSDVKRLHFQPWKGKILGGGISYFGVVIECENAIVVIQSDGSFQNIPGEATRWRVYPRSHNYENHLHIIFDNRIEILSFNQDYFQNQREKDLGITYKTGKPFDHIDLDFG